MIKVLNIHWGFSIGGVSQYVTVMEEVNRYAPIVMYSACILNRKRHIDHKTMNRLANLEIIKRDNILDFNWISLLKKLISKEKPDLIFTHGFNSHFIVWLLRLFLKDSPRCIASYHGQYHPPDKLKKFMERPYNSFTDWYLRNIAIGVISVAYVGKKYLTSVGVSENKIKIIHNGIPDIKYDDTVDNLKKDIGVSPRNIIIGAISRLEPIKGIRFLLEAFLNISNDFPDTSLVIIGAGAQEDELKEYVRAHNIESRVHFSGFKTDAARYLSAIDIFVLPSLSEFHSIGLLEAMRAGKAIIATDVGGNTESITHGIEGLVIKSGNVSDIINALKQIIADENLRYELGKAARERFLTEFIIEEMIRKSADFLYEAATGKTNVAQENFS